MGILEHILPTTPAGWIAAGTAVVLGAIAIYGVADKQLRDRRKEALVAADETIKVLHDTVEQLKRRVKALEEEHIAHTRQIDELKATNEILTKILQGRDDNTIAFQQRVLDTTQSTNNLVRGLDDAVRKMAGASERLVEAIEHKQI